jgi:hypothetical protein
MVLMALADRYNQTSGRCDPAVTTIAADAMVSVRTVQMALPHLTNLGLIEVVKRENMTSQYVLKFDVRITETDTSDEGAEDAPEGAQTLHRGGASVAGGVVQEIREGGAPDAPKPRNLTKEEEPKTLPPISPRSDDLFGLEEPKRTMKASLAIKDAVEQWNRTAEACGLPKVETLSTKRVMALKTILLNHGVRKWEACLAQIPLSDHLLGLNDRKWRADFDFLVREDKFLQVLEGRYVKSTARKLTAGEYARISPEDDIEARVLRIEQQRRDP